MSGSTDAQLIFAGFCTVTRRQGAKGPLSSRFAVCRVRHAQRTSASVMPQEAYRLIAEWPLHEAAPTKFFSNLPEKNSRRELVRLAKRSWWVEHSSRELGDELGFNGLPPLNVATLSDRISGRKPREGKRCHEERSSLRSRSLEAPRGCAGLAQGKPVPALIRKLGATGQTS